MTAADFWRQALEIARKDLRVEGRAGEALFITVPFGAVALMLIPLAIGTDKPLLSRVGPGMFLAVSLLFGMLVAYRQTASDTPAQRELLVLLGTDPAAKFTGRVAASSLLLVVFEIVLVPVTVIFYNPGFIPGWPWLLVVMVLLALGLSLIGTLAGAVTAGLRTRNTLTPLLVAPLAMPLLLSSGQVVEALRGRDGILLWLGIPVVMNLGIAVLGVLTARPLEDASR